MRGDQLESLLPAGAHTIITEELLTKLCPSQGGLCSWAEVPELVETWSHPPQIMRGPLNSSGHRPPDSLDTDPGDNTLFPRV